jgi:hypothetical protein
VIVEPTSLDQLRIEFWVTAVGSVAVGIENRGRFARRVGVTTSAPSTFLAGHEPAPVSHEYLSQVVALVADGAVVGRGRAMLGKLVSVQLHPLAGRRLALGSFYSLARTWVPIGRRIDAEYRPW